MILLGNEFTLHLKANRLRPEGTVVLAPENICANDVDMGKRAVMKLYVVGNQFGPLCAVWARHDSDAIDEAIDSGLADGILIDENDADSDTPRGGNAGEPYDGEYTWLSEVELIAGRDVALMLAFAEAKGAGANTLADFDGYVRAFPKEMAI